MEMYAVGDRRFEDIGDAVEFALEHRAPAVVEVEPSRADALARPGAEVLMNGRCVGHLEYDQRYGTCLVMDWHAESCEHLVAVAS